MIGMTDAPQHQFASRMHGAGGRRLSLIGLLLGVMTFPQASVAQSSPVTTASSQIVKLQSDWNANALIVTLSSATPFVNPSNCPLTNDYETNPNDPGAALNQSMLISAYMGHTSVALAIQGCSLSQRPHIVGVTTPN